MIMRNLLLYASIMIMFTSCSAKWWAKKCSYKFPIRDSITEHIVFKDGEVIELAGATVYMNCDSAMEVVRKMSAKGLPVTLKTSHIPCPPCPPSTSQHDTLFKYINHYMEDSAKLFLVRKDLNKYKESSARWERFALWEGIFIALLLLAIALWVLIKKKI